jgi:hypothetical protein
MRPLAWVLVCALIGVPLFGLGVIVIVFLAKQSPPAEVEQAGLPRPAERREARPTSSAEVEAPSPPDRAKEKSGESETPVEVPVATFYNEYSKDLVAADMKYLRKRITLTGVRGKVEKDKDGRYFIGAHRWRVVNRPVQTGIMPSREAARQIYDAAANSKVVQAVIIYIGKDAVADFRGVTEQAEIIIEGRCSATLRDPATTPDLVVIIEDARRVK